MTICLGRTSNELCFVSALLNYLARRSAFDGPLFILEDGSYLSRDVLIKEYGKPSAIEGLTHLHTVGTHSGLQHAG